jgi:hypothetical protein
MRAAFVSLAVASIGAAQPVSTSAAPPVSTSTARPAAPADAFAQLEGLAGDWEADLPGYGKMHDTVRLISNGMAIEETIGTAADNEASIYTRDGDRVLITHYCAMTPDSFSYSPISPTPADPVNISICPLRPDIQGTVRPVRCRRRSDAVPP